MNFNGEIVMAGISKVKQNRPTEPVSILDGTYSRISGLQGLATGS